MASSSLGVFDLDNYSKIDGDPDAPKVVYFDELEKKLETFVGGDAKSLQIDACEGQHLADNDRRIFEARLEALLKDEAAADMVDCGKLVQKALALENIIDVVARQCAQYGKRDKTIHFSLFRIHSPTGTFGEKNNMVYSRDDLINNVVLSFSSIKRMSSAEARRDVAPVQAIVQVIGDLHMTLLHEENCLADWNQVDPLTKFALEFISGYWTTKLYGNSYLKFLRVSGETFSEDNEMITIGEYHFSLSTAQVYGHLIKEVVKAALSQGMEELSSEEPVLGQAGVIVQAFLSGDFDVYEELIAANSLCLSIKGAHHAELTELNISRYLSKALLEVADTAEHLPEFLRDLAPVFDAFQNGTEEEVQVGNLRVILSETADLGRPITFPHQGDDNELGYLDGTMVLGEGQAKLRISRVRERHLYLEPQRRDSFKAIVSEDDRTRNVIFKRKERQMQATMKYIAQRKAYHLYNAVRSIKVLSCSLSGDKLRVFKVSAASYWANRLFRDAEDIPAAIKLLSMLLEGSIDARKTHEEAVLSYVDVIHQSDNGIVFNSMISSEVVRRLVFLTDKEKLFLKVWDLQQYYEVKRVSRNAVHLVRSDRTDNHELLRCSLLSNVCIG